MGTQGTLPRFRPVEVEEQIPHLAFIGHSVGEVLLITADLMGVPAPHVVSTDSLEGGTLLAGGDESPGSLLGLL